MIVHRPETHAAQDVDMRGAFLVQVRNVEFILIKNGGRETISAWGDAIVTESTK